MAARPNGALALLASARRCWHQADGGEADEDDMARALSEDHGSELCGAATKAVDSYPMLCNSASGPEIGLPGRISGRILMGKVSNSAPRPACARREAGFCGSPY